MILRLDKKECTRTLERERVCVWRKELDDGNNSVTSVGLHTLEPMLFSWVPYNFRKSGNCAKKLLLLDLDFLFIHDHVQQLVIDLVCRMLSL